MRKISFFSGLFGVLGLFTAVLGLVLALSNIDASPVLVEQPKAAREQVETMLDALCEADYDTVSACLYGEPKLGLDREAVDPVGQMLYQALVESFSYEMVGDFHATDSGVSLNVVISALDLDSVTVSLRDRARARLEQRIDEAEDPSEVYGEDHEIREEFVMEALHQAARDALAEDATRTTWELSLNLIYENGKWWIMPENTLLQAISGGILK